jgi:hypothetical protein
VSVRRPVYAVVAAVLFGLPAAADNASLAGPGWVRLESRPAAEDLRCAGYVRSGNRWVVSTLAGGIAVSEHSPVETVDPLPFSVPRDRDRLGARHVLRVDDGWLVGYDGGEFGGALWWFSGDGSRSYRAGPSAKPLEAISLPVQGFVQFAERNLVFRGLDHLTLRAGAAFSIQKASGRWRLVPFAQLDGQALGWLVRDGRLIVLTASGIWSTDGVGGVRPEFRFGEDWPWPTSLAADQSSLYVGLPRYVLELSSVPSGWSEIWHVQQQCQRAQLVEWECRCLP